MAIAVQRPVKRRVIRAPHLTVIGAVLLVLVVVIAILAVLVISGGSPESAAPSTIRISDKDAGRMVQMRTGDTLEVSLEANPTTGYSWDVAVLDTAVLKQAGEQQFVPDSTALGAPGKAVLTFQAAGIGKTALELIYHRPFEEGVAPLKTFEATIEVR